MDSTYENSQQSYTFSSAPNVFANSYSGESSREGPYNMNYVPQTSITQQYDSPALMENQTFSFSTSNLSQNQNQLIHPNVFYYRPPNDFYHYHVRCKELSNNIIKDLLNELFKNEGLNVQLKENEWMFFYQQQYNNRFYEITCEIVSPSSITGYL